MKEELDTHSDNTASMGLLGDYLKQKRVDKNYTLEKLSQKTKISINILKNLEANDYEHLPSAAYIKGFVTSYIKVLGLPHEEAINKMEYTYLNMLGKPFPALNHTKLMAAQMAAKAAPPVQETSPHEVIESSNSIISNTKSILPIAILAGVILTFIGGYKIVSSIVENEVNSHKPSTQGPKIESSSALVKQPVRKSETKTPAKTDESTDETTEQKTEEVKVAQPFERNFPHIDFRKIRSRLFSVKTDAPENEDLSLLPETIKDATISDLQNVYIKAVTGNTWLSYKIDNNPIESVIIKQGNDLFLQGAEIRVFLGNLNVTKIFYNNYLIDAPTKSGVKSLIFPEESNSKFQLPLFPKAKDDILYTAEEYTKRMKLEEEELLKRQATTN